MGFEISRKRVVNSTKNIDCYNFQALRYQTKNAIFNKTSGKNMRSVNEIDIPAVL